MVPIDGENKIKVQITEAPAAWLAKMKFVSHPPGKLTITPEIPTSADQELTFTGTVSHLGVKVQLELDGVKIDLFEADVLKKFTKTLQIHDVTEENDDVQKVGLGVNAGPYQVCVEAGANGFRDTIPAVTGDDVIVGNIISTGPNGICETEANSINLPPLKVTTAEALGAYLNKTTWGNQANVLFTVTKGGDRIINFDFDLNKKMEFPNSQSVSVEGDWISFLAWIQTGSARVGLINGPGAD